MRLGILAAVFDLNRFAAENVFAGNVRADLRRSRLIIFQ